jgi:hypothetical protein
MAVMAATRRTGDIDVVTELQIPVIYGTCEKLVKREVVVGIARIVMFDRFAEKKL